MATAQVIKLSNLEDFTDKIKRLKSNTMELYFQPDIIFRSPPEMPKQRDIKSSILFTAVVDNTLYLSGSLISETSLNAEDFKMFQQEINKYMAETKDKQNAIIDRVKKECAGWRLVEGSIGLVGVN